jgi:hypothetical protein
VSLHTQLSRTCTSGWGDCTSRVISCCTTCYFQLHPPPLPPPALTPSPYTLSILLSLFLGAPCLSQRCNSHHDSAQVSVLLSSVLDFMRYNYYYFCWAGACIIVAIVITFICPCMALSLFNSFLCPVLPSLTYANHSDSHLIAALLSGDI